MSCARMTRSKAALLAVVMAAGLPTVSYAMSMEEALLLAEKIDPAVTGSLALLDAERELGKQERATRLPQVNAVAGMRETDSKITATPFPNPDGSSGFSERYNSWDAAVELRQPLFRFDFFARGRRANALDELAEAGAIVREQRLIYRVAERYLGVLQAKSALRLAQSEADAVSRSLSDTQKRYDVQLIPGTDLKEAQARNDLAQANLIAARQALDTAQDLLDESTGQGYAELPEFPANAILPVLDDDSREVWLERVMTQNPSLRAARANLQVAKANADSSMSSALPEIDVVASHGRQDSSDSLIGSAGNNSIVGLELRVPIFASGGNRSRVKEADARRRVAEGELDSAIRSTQRETRRLLADVQTSRLQVSAFERAVASAEAAEQATKYGYEAGKRTMVDVLNAQSASTEARRNYDQARFGHLLSMLRLKQQAGALGLQDFKTMDQLIKPASAHEATQ